MHYKYTDIKAIVAEILENKKDEGGVKNIYFVGCGGSLGALYPAKTFMERESLTLKSGWVSCLRENFWCASPARARLLRKRRSSESWMAC